MYWTRTRELLQKGLLHIISANVLAKVFAFLSSLAVVRILTKEEYGSYSYALNIISLFMLANGLGTAGASMQYCSESRDDRSRLSFFKYGLQQGVRFDWILILVIGLCALTVTLPVAGSNYILLGLAATPMLWLLQENQLVYLRTTLQNRQYSVLSALQPGLTLLFVIILGVLYSTWGVVVAQFVGLLSAILLGHSLYFRKLIPQLKSTATPPRTVRLEFLRYSAALLMINAVGRLLYLADLFLIGVIVKEEEVIAAYRVASLIPQNLLSLPLAVVIFAYPYFARRQDDPQWIRKKLHLMMGWLAVLTGAISLLAIVFASSLIPMLFGDQYYDAVAPFRILMAGFVVAGAVRIPAGNVIASLRKVKVSFYGAMASGAANIVLDVVLIMKYQSMGAAVATTLTILLSAAYNYGYLCWYLKSKPGKFERG